MVVNAAAVFTLVNTLFMLLDILYFLLQFFFSIFL